MVLKIIRNREAATCAVIGVAGALVFLFAFPKGSISTLMHEVLRLPGPGAGIALIFGPVLTFVVLISSLSSRGSGGAVIASLAFAATCAAAVALLDIPTNPKGAFGSLVSAAAIAQLGLVAEVVMALGQAVKRVRRCLLAGAVANAALLAFYWVAIFPRTAGWVRWRDVPLLMGLCLACGLAAGYIAWVVFNALSRAFAPEEKE